MRFNNGSFNRLQGKTYYTGVFANRNIFTDLANGNVSLIIDSTHEIA